jgi:rubrerythrin
MPRSIDFSSLDLRDALDLAILIEEEARERYTELAGRVGGRYVGDASDVFTRMAGNEAKHADQLNARRRELFGDAPRQVSASQFWQVEAPDQGDVRVFMSARQAFEVALDAETRAFAFYQAAAEKVADASVRDLFLELRDEEQAHQAAISRLMQDLPTGPDLDEDDADEPAAQ